jgi:uncharacterized protein
VSGVPAVAPELPRPVLFDQRWCDLTFVHWPVRPETVGHFFPPGTRPDVFDDGLTYVALVPFVMRDAGFSTLPGVPYFGSFLETNIRLYSVDDAGRHGVLFRSLDCSRLAIVAFANTLLGMRYTWSRMRYSHVGDVVSYEATRRLPQRGLRSRVTVRVGQRVEPTPLEVFLTARWGAHTRVAGRTIWVPNAHGTWPLHECEVMTLDDELLAGSGVEAAGPPLRALWSPGVHSRFGRPALVGRP